MEIYLDNSATTKPIKPAIDACNFALNHEFGNPSSLHKRGFEAEKLMTNSRSQIAKALSCNEGEIIFTSGATESNNLAIIGSALAYSRRGKKIITTAIEHPSVKLACAYLETQGFQIKEIFPNTAGEYTADQFASEVDDQTILVTCMFVNNETGLILPINDIANAVKRKNSATIIHVDAVQAFMKLPIKLNHLQVDLMSISGHKVGAIKGVGGLFIRKGIRLIPQTYGGGQENGLRCGTQSVPLISAFGSAVASQLDDISDSYLYYSKLNQHLVERLSSIPEIKINSNASQNQQAPHICNFSVCGFRSEVMLHFLEQKEIYVSSGSACAKGKQSYVLSAFKLDKARSDSALRISFCKDVTIAQLDTLVSELKAGINTLARIK